MAPQGLKLQAQAQVLTMTVTTDPKEDLNGKEPSQVIEDNDDGEDDVAEIDPAGTGSNLFLLPIHG